MSTGAHHLARKFFTVMTLGVLLPAAAHSTTFVSMDERELLRSSAVVLIGSVTAIESGAASDGVISTYVHIQPERIIKGSLRLDPVVIREPGGTVGEQRQVVFGSPEFWVGERALLFLSRNHDGTLQTNSLAMGKFSLTSNAEGHIVAERDFGFGASMLAPSTGAMMDAPRQTRRFLPLLRRLRRLAHAERLTHRPSVAVTPVPEELRNPSTRFQEAYTFMSNPPVRWFQPDSGQPVTYYLDSTGDRKLGFTASQAAMDGAFAAWTNVPTANLVLQDGGTTSPAPFGPCDMNRITFNDPYNEITDPSGCSGVLAIGGYCGGGGSRVVNGTTFRQILVGKVTFNNGWSGCSFWNQCNVAEVATHEIGHTIGLGHSNDTNATMYAMAHFDGRCATVMTDDINGVSFIYPQVGTPAPTATRANTATPTATRTSVPTRTPTPTWTRVPTRTPTRTWTPISSRTPTMTTRPTNTGLPTTPTATSPPAPTATRGIAVLNDACASAIVVTTSPFLGTLNTIAATRDVTDPVPPCAPAATARTVWYQYTAPRAGTIVASTSGSTYDTVLSAYTGSCGSFSPVPAGCNDNLSLLQRQSQISITAVAGRTYYFMVSTTSMSAGGTTSFRLVLN